MLGLIQLHTLSLKLLTFSSRPVMETCYHSQCSLCHASLLLYETLHRQKLPNYHTWATYWDIVEDHIVHGQGPMVMSFKLGYLLPTVLSGSLPVDKTTATITNTLHVPTHCHDECDLAQFWQLESTGTISVKFNTNDRSYLKDKYKLPTRLVILYQATYHGRPVTYHYHLTVKSAREVNRKLIVSLNLQYMMPIGVVMKFFLTQWWGI